ncbi:MAG TPA: hypothetical protein VHG91_02545 [Longimicrobium sp.]|nr:hypothetical protein [Longimicrobium sp.]
MKTIFSALALALAVSAAPLAAQEAPAGGELCPHVALQHREALGLSASQVARLEALQKQVHGAEGHHAMAGHAGHHAAGAAHPAGHAQGGDHAQHHAAGAAHPAGHAQHQAQGMGHEMSAAMRQAHQETAALLTADQRARLAGLHAEHAAHAGHEGGCDCCQDGACDAERCRAHCGEAGMQACCDRCCKDGKHDEAACKECCEAGCGGAQAGAHAHG